MGIREECHQIMQEGHGKQQRVSGEPYVTHPIEVEKLYRSICPHDYLAQGICFIHDVVEDSAITLRELANFLGHETAFMVDALSKRSPEMFRCREERLRDYYNRLFSASQRDKRVALIKFADRYHNVSTIDFLDRKRALRILKETEEVLLPFFRSLKVPMTGELTSLCRQKKAQLVG
jgi:(p)ppGpp synthase/HD superfamily hydrolase